MRCWPTGRYLRMLAAPLVLATALSGQVPAEASAGTCQARTSGQPITPPGAGSDIKGVTVQSLCNAWTVGFFSDVNNNELTLAEHWDGTAWTVVPTPNPPGSIINRLNSVRARTAHDIWAVGSSTLPGSASRALIERYNGTSWTQVTAPAPGSTSALNSVRPVSANDAWAVGGYQASGREKVLILRWNGTTWQQKPGLNPEFSNSLSSIAATSSHDVWAVGSSADRNGNRSVLILHWNGRQWRNATLPHLGSGSALGGVGASSATSAWAVGEHGNEDAARPLLLHWNGTRWKQFTGPRGLSGGLNGVYVNSSKDAWAAGQDNSTKALLLHWNGSRWTRVARPVPGAESRLFAVAASSAKNIWAVGDFTTTPGLGSTLLGLHIP